MGDCSSYTVGAIGVCNHHGTLISNDLLASIMVHHIVGSKLDWTSYLGHVNKFLFTNQDYHLDSGSDTTGKVYKALLAVAGKHGVEHKYVVKGWKGEPLDLRIVEVEKNSRHQEELNIPWKDLTIEGTFQWINNSTKHALAKQNFNTYDTIKKGW
jgi:thiamine pyrophosphate-dependent acetolactate synthase large subunit-like protein